MVGVEGEGTHAEMNVRAYWEGVKEARSGRNYDRPERDNPTEEERLFYRMGFYNELEVMEEDALDEEEGG